MGRIKTKKIKIKLKKLKGGSFPDDETKIIKGVNKELKERCQFMDKDVETISDNDYGKIIKDSLGKLDKTLKLYNEKSYKKLKVGYPDFHGEILDIDDYKVVPDNHILCFLTELGNLGLPYYNDSYTLNNFINNLSKGELDLIMDNLALLNDTKQFNTDINGADIYNNCFSNASWYFPGQKYINVSMEMDDIADKFYYKDFIRGFSCGVEDEDTYNNKITLSDFIDEIKTTDGNETNNIYLYFFIICRPYRDRDIQKIIITLRNEMIMNTINREIMREYKGKLIETGLSLLCGSESQNTEGLVDPDIIDNYHSINKDQHYIYNRKTEFMMYFYNKVLTNFDKMNRDDILLFFKLSFGKQTFILRKFIKIGLNNDILRKLIYLLINNYFLNSQRLDYVYQDLYAYYLSFKNNEIEDFYYIYKEQHKDFFYHIQKIIDKESDILNEIMKKLFIEMKTQLNTVIDNKTVLSAINYVYNKEYFFNNVCIIIVDNKATEENINKLLEELKKPTNKILKVVIENINPDKRVIIQKLWNNIFYTMPNKIDFDINNYIDNNKRFQSLESSIQKNITININEKTKINIFTLENVELNSLEINISGIINNNLEIVIINCDITIIDITGDDNINNKKVKIIIYNSIISNINIQNNNTFIVFENCDVPIINYEKENNILHLTGGDNLVNFSFRDTSLSNTPFEELKFKNIDIVNSNRFFSLYGDEKKTIIKCKNLIFDNYQDKNESASSNDTFYNFHYEKLTLIGEYPKYLKINYKSLKTIDRRKTKIKKHKFIKKHNIDRGRLRRIKII